MSKVLIIEDEPTTRLLLKRCIEKLGHRATESSSGSAGLRNAMESSPDLVVLDVNLPDFNGFEVCKALRNASFSGAILMLTGRSSIEDKATGFGSGADDYICKPYDIRELRLRISALLRRHSWHNKAMAHCRLGDVDIDLDKRIASKEGCSVDLTKTEWSLLQLLMQYPGKPVSRDTILDSVWGYDKSPSPRTVDTHVWRLRRKLGGGNESNNPIENVHGEGYRLQVPGKDA